MNHRQSTMVKSVFYRGISLKEYLRKTTETQKQTSFKDEDTIFLGQDNQPIQIADNFILREKTPPLCLSHRYQRKTTTTTQDQQIHFPDISHKKPLPYKRKSLVSDRFSTDASLPLCDIKKSQLPLIEPREYIQKRQRMDCEQSESRCSSFRGTPSFLELNANIFNDYKSTPKGRSLSNRKTQLIQKQIEIKQRYGLIDRPTKQIGNKAVHFARVKSHLQ